MYGNLEKQTLFFFSFFCFNFQSKRGYIFDGKHICKQGITYLHTQKAITHWIILYIPGLACYNLVLKIYSSQRYESRSITLCYKLCPYFISYFYLIHLSLLCPATTLRSPGFNDTAVIIPQCWSTLTSWFPEGSAQKGRVGKIDVF